CAAGRSIRWRAAGATTSSAAASTATPPTANGTCRTSRRCSTTTACSSSSTPGSTRAAATPRRSASSTRPRPSWRAIDAETDGHEGAFYVWTRGELEAVLGPEDAPFLAPLFGFDRPPFFEGTHYVLHQPMPFEEVARRRKMEIGELLSEIAPLRARLFAARAERKRPATDDKILADWNGTAITGLAVAGELLHEPLFIESAARAADFVLSSMRPDGLLLHSWRAGNAKIPAFLADYAFVVRGLLALHRATGDGTWLAAARSLTDEQIARLGDPQGGFFTAGESPEVLFRSKELFDGALPAANGIAI